MSELTDELDRLIAASVQKGDGKRPWTPEEDEILVQYGDRVPRHLLAVKLGRSYDSVTSRFKRIKVFSDPAFALHQI